MYYNKLKMFFKNEGLNQKQVAEIMGYSESMIGRYLKGTAKFDADFIVALTIKFPKIDLKYIFNGENVESEQKEEDGSLNYEMSNKEMINELQSIEDKIAVLKNVLARNCHEKK